VLCRRPRDGDWRRAWLAGSAAVTLLVLLIVHDPLSSMAYLATFGVGTIAGMMLITALVGCPFYTRKHTGTASSLDGCDHGMFSASFGVFLVYQIGFAMGSSRR
jgi:high-affinity nickel-transport protein